MEQAHEASPAGKPAYAAPTIRVMNEEEMLKTFQLTSAMGGWWINPGASG